MHKLLIIARDSDQYRQQIEMAALPLLEFVESASEEVELVLGEPTGIRALLPALPALKWVQSTWAGVEPLLDPALRRDYLLTNARGVFGGLMSEFVFGYLLMHERRILQRLDAQKQGKWDPTLTGTLRGKTIGLLGVGSIGAHLAGSAKHFGMAVYGYTRSSETCGQVDRYYHAAELGAFAAGLDVLVNVLPNTSQTRKIVDAGLLAALHPRAVFINVGRGTALDEPALVSALETDRLALAVLDVFEQEPLPARHPFWHTKNLFITSHTAAPSFPQDIVKVFIENYRLFSSGKALNYQVDFERGY